MSLTSDSESAPGGPFGPLKELGRTAVNILHTRFDLLVTEIEEEQNRLAELLLYAALALFFLFVTIILVGPPTQQRISKPIHRAAKLLTLTKWNRIADGRIEHMRTIRIAAATIQTQIEVINHVRKSVAVHRNIVHILAERIVGRHAQCTGIAADAHLHGIVVGAAIVVTVLQLVELREVAQIELRNAGSGVPRILTAVQVIRGRTHTPLREVGRTQTG